MDGITILVYETIYCRSPVKTMKLQIMNFLWAKQNCVVISFMTMQLFGYYGIFKGLLIKVALIAQFT